MRMAAIVTPRINSLSKSLAPPILLDELLPNSPVPPVWVLSACHTSVTGAMRGCFVARPSWKRCFIASSPVSAAVDAFTASMFVGRLLRDIFNPASPDLHNNFQGRLLFNSIYDSAFYTTRSFRSFGLPKKDLNVRKKKLSSVLSDFFKWTHGRELDIRKYRHEIAWFVGEAILRKWLARNPDRAPDVGNCETRKLCSSRSLVFLPRLSLKR